MGRKISMKKIFLTAILTAIYTCTTVYAAYYPVSIDESIKNGVRTITKSYELNQNDDVTAISKEGFEQNGSFFVFKDMVKTEHAAGGKQGIRRKGCNQQQKQQDE